MFHEDIYVAKEQTQISLSYNKAGRFECMDGTNFANNKYRCLVFTDILLTCHILDFQLCNLPVYGLKGQVMKSINTL